MGKTDEGVNAGYVMLLDPSDETPIGSEADRVPVGLAPWHYIGGGTFTLDGTNDQQLNIPADATIVELRARGGEVYFSINGVSCAATDPGYIPDMIEALKGHDLVVGSRFVPGGCDERTSVIRTFISLFARVFINKLLATGVEDPTSGFKCFSGEILARIDPATLRAENHFICTETLYRAVRKGARVKEIPIRFHPRSGNISKLTPGILFDCFVKVIILGIRKW